MILRMRRLRRWLSSLAACAVFASIVATQYALAAKPGSLLHRSNTKQDAAAPAYSSPSSDTSASPAAASNAVASRPAYQLAERSEAAQAASAAPRLAPGQAGEHPLMPVLRWAYSGIGNVEKIQDYSATVAKRERIAGKVGEYEYMFVKLRQHPFSVYMYFLGPPAIKGQEVLYVEGQNDNNMWAHTVGVKNTLFGTVSIKPDGPVAMRGQRYPLTELGILNLTRRLVEVGEQDVNFGECDVKFYEGAKINNRVCTCIEVVHPVPRRNFRYHLARIFVDKELNLPIRYESYDWPKEKGGAPELLEEYTYLNLKLNNGFTNADFDTKNPNSKFR
ncbi:MAG: DUF1571 domain-containing protein [Thermoguttaceae bacterium]